MKTIVEYLINKNTKAKASLDLDKPDYYYSLCFIGKRKNEIQLYLCEKITENNQGNYVCSYIHPKNHDKNVVIFHRNNIEISTNTDALIAEEFQNFDIMLFTTEVLHKRVIDHAQNMQNFTITYKERGKIEKFDYELKLSNQAAADNAANMLIYIRECKELLNI